MYVVDQIFHQLLGEIHVALQITKSHLGFDHPKFVGVPRGVGVLRAKSRTKSVNFGKSAGEGFGFELSADGQVGRASEEISGPVDFAVRQARRIFRIERCNTEQFACAFAVAPGDDRRVHVNKTAFLEKLMDRKGEPAADAKNAAEKIRARTKMGDLAQELGRMPFLLQRISIVRCTDDFDLLSDQFPVLPFALRCDERALHRRWRPR